MSQTPFEDEEVQYVIDHLVQEGKQPAEIARLLERCAELCANEGLSATARRLRAGAAHLVETNPPADPMPPRTRGKGRR